MIVWYVVRARGTPAYVLLRGSVILGLLLSGRVRLPDWPRFALEDIHRFAGLLSGTFIVVHVSALLVDDYVPFSLTDILVPGTAPYRPLSVALGVVAAELLVALALTNRYRKALSHRFWRRGHYPKFAGRLPPPLHRVRAGD